MKHEVFISGKKYPVAVSWKTMKNVRLKVFPSGEIKLSVPTDTPDDWISAYLSEKADWIEDKLESFVKTRAIEKEEHYISGTSTRILGRQVTVIVHPASQKSISCEDDLLHIYTTESEQALIDKQANNWWQKTAKQYYCEVAKRLYPIIEKHGIDMPDICVKKMKTLWGSCSRKHCKINLNFFLYKATVPCIEYVILHEMLHLLYPYHNKDFYDLLTIHMPDWESRERQLDYETVLGI